MILEILNRIVCKLIHIAGFGIFLATSFNANCQPRPYSLLEVTMVGDQYWISGARLHPQKIAEICPSLPCSKDKEDWLQLPDDERFRVAAKFSPSKMPLDFYTAWLKLEFESGKIGYISFGAFASYLIPGLDLSESEFERRTSQPFVSEIKPSEFISRGREKFAVAKRQAEVLEEAKQRDEVARRARGGVRIGMTKAQVLKSAWGHPQTVNRTVTAGRVWEQWVYHSQHYLYFENEKLVSVQTSN